MKNKVKNLLTGSFIYAGVDLVKYATGISLSKDKHHLLVACMPKSGSTFLTRIISELPGFSNVALVPGYGHREQELDTLMLLYWHRKNYVAQHHVRYSETLSQQITRFGLRPIVLVRNIYDIVISIKDHLRNESVVSPMGYVFPYMTAWDDAELEIFIANMILPWYFNFYLSWLECENKLLIRYEKLRENPVHVVSTICEFYKLGLAKVDIESAIEAAKSKNTRKNKGIAGRGLSLAPEAREHIDKMASFYKGVDFSPIGIAHKQNA
ncbi:MAG: hypothetical protein D6712_08630 [Chloroflexi bacterium]|nr:MAG: hypothetical protein D6712_08630 [Chloroflexota bacterium]